MAAASKPMATLPLPSAESREPVPVAVEQLDT